MKVTHNGQTHYGASRSDLESQGLPAGVVLSAVADQLNNAIDAAAGNARAAFVSPGSYIDQEYLIVKREARDWLDAGADESAIPTSISDHMETFGVGAETAAQDIVATAEQWEQALGAIRTARLRGKSSVRNAGTVEDAEQAAQKTIGALNAVRPPEGAL